VCAWKTGQYRQCLTTSRLLCGAETAVTVRAVGRELSRHPVRLFWGGMYLCAGNGLQQQISRETQKKIR
jgi:hypothetical protein